LGLQSEAIVLFVGAIAEINETQIKTILYKKIFLHVIPFMRLSPDLLLKIFCGRDKVNYPFFDLRAG
jgi:hypothetical protein